MHIRKLHMWYGYHFKTLDALKGVSRTTQFPVDVRK